MSLEQALERTLFGLQASEDWAALRDRLASAVSAAEADRSAEHEIAVTLLAGLDETIGRLPVVAWIGPDASIADLIAALPETRVHPSLFVRPAEYDRDDDYLWDTLRDDARYPRDPAVLLYERGRAAVPELIEALRDVAATRSADLAMGRRGPVVLRVADVAMGLIEAIAHRPLRQQGENLPAQVSQWSERQRGELMVRLTTWWEETRELDAAGAALWKLDEEHHVVQVQVLNGLLRGGHARAVIEYLEPRFRKGNELWRDFPTLLLRAGSRAPLDIVAQQASVNLMLSQDKVQLIAEYGDDRDFQQLARYVKRVAERSPANTPSHMKAVVDGLRKTRDHRAVPVLVAVLEWEVSRLGGDGAAALVPLYVDEAVKLLEAWSGVPFGHRQVDSPARRLRAVGEVLRWWESGGRSAYALAYNPRHGSGGLR